MYTVKQAVLFNFGMLQLLYILAGCMYMYIYMYNGIKILKILPSYTPEISPVLKVEIKYGKKALSHISFSQLVLHLNLQCSWYQSLLHCAPTIKITQHCINYSKKRDQKLTFNLFLLFNFILILLMLVDRTEYCEMASNKTLFHFMQSVCERVIFLCVRCNWCTYN